MLFTYSSRDFKILILYASVYFFWNTSSNFFLMSYLQESISRACSPSPEICKSNTSSCANSSVALDFVFFNSLILVVIGPFDLRRLSKEYSCSSSGRRSLYGEFPWCKNSASLQIKLCISTNPLTALSEKSVVTFNFFNASTCSLHWTMKFLNLSAILIVLIPDLPWYVSCLKG